MKEITTEYTVDNNIGTFSLTVEDNIGSTAVGTSLNIASDTLLMGKASDNHALTVDLVWGTF